MLSNESDLIIILIPIAVFLVYSPILWYLDIKYRDIFTHKIWLPAITINTPLMVLAYYTGILPILPLVPLSCIAVLFWFIAYKCGVFNGADFVFLSLICIFIPIIPSNHHMIFLPLCIFLAIFITIFSFWDFANRIRKVILKIPPRETVVGYPMLPAISLALIFSLVFG